MLTSVFRVELEHWLKLDKKAGTEDYTIIFSPTPLNEPEVS